MSRTKLALAAVVASTLLLAGCAGGGDSPEAHDVVTIGLGPEPANLDFTTTDGAAIPQALLDNVYEGLVTLTDDGDIAPLLATSWDVSEDNLTYTFTLADDVTFSNGDAFDAETVKWNIENVQSDAWSISLKSYMDVVSAVDVIDESTVAVTLAHPSNDWLFRMTTRIGAMFSPDAVDELATTAVGTGPYEVVSFDRGDSITLELRDGYWGEEPEINTVVLRYFDDVNAQNSALLSGSINAIYNLQSIDTIDQFSTDKFEVIEGGTNSEVTLSMNNASGIFTDVRVRQAVSYAINRQAIIDSATAGYGLLIGSMVPPTDAWFDEALVDAYPYDPELAQELLAQAGAEGATIRFKVPTVANITPAAQIVQSDLSAIGLNVEFETLEFPAQWLEQVFTNQDYDMSIVNHVEARDMATYADPTYYWGYDSPEFQALVASADAGTAEEQVADLTEAAAMLSAEAVSNWLYLEPNINVVQLGLSGLPANWLSEALNLTHLSWS